MTEKFTPPSERTDRSVHAYSAICLCFFGLLIGGLAIRSHREEVMMRTMPAVAATVLWVKPTKHGFAARIAFTRIADGVPVACNGTTVLDHGDERAHVGAVVRVIPRPDSCGEPAVIGERSTKLLAAFSGIALLASLVSGIVAAHSVLRKRTAKPAA